MRSAIFYAWGGRGFSWAHLQRTEWADWTRAFSWSHAASPQDPRFHGQQDAALPTAGDDSAPEDATPEDDVASSGCPPDAIAFAARLGVAPSAALSEPVTRLGECLAVGEGRRPDFGCAEECRVLILEGFTAHSGVTGDVVVKVHLVGEGRTQQAAGLLVLEGKGTDDDRDYFCEVQAEEKQAQRRLASSGL